MSLKGERRGSFKENSEDSAGSHSPERKKTTIISRFQLEARYGEPSGKNLH